MSERERLADKLQMEHWDGELLALFALQRIEELESALKFLRGHDGECLGDHLDWLRQIDDVLRT